MVMVDTNGVKRMIFRDRVADVALMWQSGELDGITALYNVADSIAYDIIQYAVEQAEENRREPEDQVPQ